MKTYKDYLIDFNTLKVNDEVWSPIGGHGRIISIEDEYDYPIYILFEKGKISEYVRKDGFFSEYHVIQLLFKEKPDFFKEKKEIKRYKWYYELYDDKRSVYEHITPHFTEKECNNFINEQSLNVIKKGIIPCTEKEDIVYE